MLLLLGEETPLREELPHERGRAQREPAPGEVEADLQVPPVGRRPGRGAAPRACLAVQLFEPGEDREDPLAVDGEEALEQEQPLPFGQVFRALARHLEPSVRPRPSRGLLDLVEQHRHQVEGHLHAGMLSDQRDHVVVVLEGVQAHPRHRRHP